MARAWVVMVHAVTGDFDAGIRHGTDTIGTVKETVEALALSRVYAWLGDLYRVKGDFASALRLVEHGIDIARRADLSMHVADELHHLGIAYAEAGEIAKGRALIERSQREAAALGFGAFESLRIVRLGTAALRAGELDEARAPRVSEATKPRRCIFSAARCHSARPPVTATRSTWTRPSATSMTPLLWPTISECARSPPAATSGSGNSRCGPEPRSARARA